MTNWACVVEVELGRGQGGCGRLKGCRRRGMRLMICVRGRQEEILRMIEDGSGCSI